jgi:hypothetical protein
MKKILIILLLSGCSSTGVVPMDRDSYFIGRKDGTPGLGVSLSNKAEVYQEANAFCNNKHQNIHILTSNITPARPGQLGSTEIQFKCVSKNSEAVPMQKESDIVIETRQR